MSAAGSKTPDKTFDPAAWEVIAWIEPHARGARRAVVKRAAEFALVEHPPGNAAPRFVAGPVASDDIFKVAQAVAAGVPAAMTWPPALIILALGLCAFLAEYRRAVPEVTP